MSEFPVISFSNPVLPDSGTIVFLVGEGESLPALTVSLNETPRLERAIKIAEFKGKRLSSVNIIAPNEEIDRLFLVGCGKDKEFNEEHWLEIGGKVRRLCEKDSKVTLVAQSSDKIKFSAENLALVAMGFKLRSYEFDEYKTGAEKSKKTVKFTICSNVASAIRDKWEKLEGVCDGVITARNLINEPANKLGTVEFTRRAKKLSALGVEVEILGEKEMKDLKMQALLGVNQGAACPPYLVVMKWNGGKKKDKPIAFVGKGVVFDSGGISIKPSRGMEEMKGDMGGAAAVTGLMQALASRKAKANVVGIIGLVENMPDAAAQRPGDIVRSMSGQTIEVINTDAEGRLVLADALWYCQETFSPKFMIDLATLTGAVLVALGQHHAGLFSNNDELAKNILQAGIETSEKVWRLPLSQEYDKLIDSKNADMKNVGGRYAGAITAGQFLQRFVNDTPWAHLDMAGTAMGSPDNEYNQSWGSGFGVRLLDRLVSDYYE